MSSLRGVYHIAVAVGYLLICVMASVMVIGTYVNTERYIRGYKGSSEAVDWPSAGGFLRFFPPFDLLLGSRRYRIGSY